MKTTVMIWYSTILIVSLVTLPVVVIWIRKEYKRFFYKRRRRQIEIKEVDIQVVPFAPSEQLRYELGLHGINTTGRFGVIFEKRR